MLRLDTEDSFEGTNYAVYFSRYVSKAVVHLYKTARESQPQKEVNLKYFCMFSYDLLTNKSDS